MYIIYEAINITIAYLIADIEIVSLAVLLCDENEKRWIYNRINGSLRSKSGRWLIGALPSSDKVTH